MQDLKAAEVEESEDAAAAGNSFRLFTRESLARIERRMEEEKELEKRRELRRKREILEGQRMEEAEKEEGEEEEEETLKEKESRKPNSSLEVGKQLGQKFGEFPKELFGKPIEDIDTFYETSKVSSRQYNTSAVVRRRHLYVLSLGGISVVLSMITYLLSIQQHLLLFTID